MTELLAANFMHYWYSWIIGILLAGIAIGFVARFVVPARRLGRELADACAALALLRVNHAGGVNADPAAIAARAMTSPALSRLWAEYAETLHAQATAGQAPRWRATTLAETFFTEQALVDSPLKTEFYKHLPGILTGLGIIGTFTGLIIGLIHFDVSLDPNQAQTQLRNLINSVGHAFFVSAVAITLAMLFTWIEKSLLTARYRQVESLRQWIDGMFDVGADVEYLERLVVAAETSAAQAVHIKDALAAQLREIFTESTTRQVDAAARQSEQMAAELGRVIGERLGQPISAIAGAVDSVAARQEAVVARLVGEVLAGFSAQMQNMFAGQMQDTHQLLHQTNQAMQASAAHFVDMSVRMDAAGRDAVAAMNQRLTETVTASESRQLEQAERIARQADAAVGGIAGQVERLIARSIEASHALQATVDKLAAGTNTAIAGLNSGAATLGTAAADFAQAGQGVAATMAGTASTMENIHFASNTLLAASTATQALLGDHDAAHAQFATLVADLKETIATARREASMSADLVDRLQAAAGQLSTAERKAEEYLSRVNDVLIQAHQSFADNIERTLREANRQFQRELAQAISLLSGAIQDLGDTIDDLPARRPAP